MEATFKLREGLMLGANASARELELDIPTHFHAAPSKGKSFKNVICFSTSSTSSSCPTSPIVLSLFQQLLSIHNDTSTIVSACALVTA
jgi:hypothetical protein